MHRLFAFLALIVTLALPFTAWADAAEEARLKDIFSKIIATQKTEAAAHGSEFITEGDIQIEDAGNYYAVTLPLAKLKTKDGNVLDIGMIAINASPQAQPGTWKMTIALPTPFVMKDAAGAPLMSLAIGSQNVTGIWNESLAAFTTLNASYGDLKVEDMGKAFSGTLAKLAFSADLKEASPGKWSGPMMTRLDGLSVSIPGKQMKIGLKWGEMKFDLSGYNLAALKGSDMKDPATIIGALAKNAEGLRSALNVQEFEVIAPQPGQEAMGKFALEKGNFTLALSGLSQDKVTAQIGLDYRGLDPKPLNEQLQNLLPHEAKLNWQLNNVPLQKLTTTVQNTLGAVNTVSPAMPQMGAMALMMKLPALLSEAQTSMTVEKNYVSNDLYRAELEGNVKSDITAFTGFISDFMLGVYGLDNLIVALENAAAIPTTMYRSELRSLASNLKYFKGFAVQKKDDQGTNMHGYHFEITPQGQFLLNDKDAAALLSGNVLPPVGGEPAPTAPAQ